MINYKNLIKLGLATLLTATMTFVAGCDNDSDSSSGGSSACENAQLVRETVIRWEPVSDVDGNLVLLVPNSLGSPTITLTDASGFTDTGRRAESLSNGTTAYRFSRPGSGYTAPACLDVDGTVYNANRPDLFGGSINSTGGAEVFPEAIPIESTGILWKPISEGDGRLVILTPPTDPSSSAEILDFATGNLVETGRFTGRTNGNRATYRFSRPGGGYDSPSYLRINGVVYIVSSTATRVN